MKPYYDKDGITIYCGDCLEIMPGLDGPFDGIIADLPYGTTDCSWDTVIPLDALWVEYKRLIKERGAVVLFGSQPFTTDLINSNRKWFKYEWIWDKGRGVGHLVARHRPMQQTEDVLIFGNGATVYNPQMDKHSQKRFVPAFSSNWDGREKVKKNGNYKGRWTDERFPTNIILEPWSPKSCVHPTQKPVALLSYLIRTYTNPNEIILDNAMGSGTTLVAAQNEGRKAVGIEISEEYCKIAVERLRQPSFFSIPNQDKKEDEYKQMDITIK